MADDERDRDEQKVKTVPPDDSDARSADEEAGPSDASGPPPSQDNPPAPGGRMPPRDAGEGT